MDIIQKIDVSVEIIDTDAKLPFYANQYDAGMDICASKDCYIAPGDTVIVPTGLKFAIPEGYEIQVRPRSGISFNTPLRIANSPGTIDSGYRGELGIIVTNTSPEGTCQVEPHTIDTKRNQKGSYRIKKGDRIAQIILAPVPRMNIVVVDSVKEIGCDRGGGFGSTGTK